MMNNGQKMTDIKVLVICDERGKDIKEFMLNIQDSMDTPKLVTYTFIVCGRKTIYEAICEAESKLNLKEFKEFNYPLILSLNLLSTLWKTNIR